MGTALNKLNCTKNKPSSEDSINNNNHVNIVPHSPTNNNNDSNENDLLDQLENGNSPTHINNNNKLKPLNKPSLLTSSMLGIKKNNLTRKPLPPTLSSTTANNRQKEDANKLLQRLQGLHRKHRKGLSDGSNNKRHTISPRVMPSDTPLSQSSNLSNQSSIILEPRLHWCNFQTCTSGI